MAELRAEYRRRGPERIAELEVLLARAERTPADGTTLDGLRLKFHSITGTAGTFGLARASEIARAAEALLEGERAARAGLGPAAHTALARMVDELRELFAARPDENASPEGGEGASPAESRLATPPRASCILVADDASDRRSEMAHLLSRGGFVDEHAETPDGVLDAVRDGRVDGLVIGARFRGVPAAGVVEKVRALPGGESLAVLVVGDHSGFFDRVEALHAGADAALDRPLDEEAFLRTLGVLLERERSEPCRVLSVEDDADQAEFIRRVLESGGHNVKVCQDPARFEADVIAFRPDLVLLDVNLPGVSGHDLARFLRQSEAHAALPVVFLTAEGRDEVRIRSMRSGGDDHLVKPVAPGLLLSTVSARLERARVLRGLLTRDGLTGLLNHTAFLGGLATAWKRHERSPGRGLALVCLDLDRFKDVNDRHGHSAGDRVLAALGGLLRRRLRATDLLGRIGGEEFAIVLEELSEAEAQTLMGRILDDFGALAFHSDEGEFRVTFSAGVAMLQPGLALGPWRERADAALYDAKRNGRARVQLASRE